MSGETEKERLFIAFWPDPALQQKVEEVVAPSVKRARARPVPAENLHVTVVFIGTWPVAAREQIERVVDGLTLPHGTLLFDRIAHWRRPRIMALVAEDCPESVARYQREISAGLAAIGWAPETRPYRPHVTVGRKTHRGVRKLLEAPIRWPCDRVALVRSESGDNGSVYRPLRLWKR